MCPAGPAPRGTPEEGRRLERVAEGVAQRQSQARDLGKQRFERGFRDQSALKHAKKIAGWRLCPALRFMCLAHNINGAWSGKRLNTFIKLKFTIFIINYT